MRLPFVYHARLAFSSVMAAVRYFAESAYLSQNVVELYFTQFVG